jgi:choline kinase
VGRFLRERRLPGECILHNEEFTALNNWYSVLLALRECAAETPDRIFVLNSDLFAPVATYRDFVTRSRASGAEACLAVDGVRPLTDEAMKVQVEHGRIVDIGKVGVSSPSGEYIGMLMLDGNAAGLLREAMEEWLVEGTDPAAWYETVIRERLLSRAVCRPIEVGGEPWVEIDDLADLEAARAVAR